METIAYSTAFSAAELSDTFAPKGDGNLILDPEKSTGFFPIPLPRKGMETLVGKKQKFLNLYFPIPLPRKGMETEEDKTKAAETKDFPIPLPRKGMETSFQLTSRYTYYFPIPLPRKGMETFLSTHLS